MDMCVYFTDGLIGWERSKMISEVKAKCATLSIEVVIFHGT